MMKNAVMNWSTGKDSAYCLYKVLQDPEIEVKYLLTTVNNDLQRVSMHGVQIELLERQAESIGIPLIKIHLPSETSMEEYNQIMSDAMKPLVANGIEYSIFGDIFLEDLRKYREEKLDSIGLKAIFPLWQMNTKLIIRNFIDQNFRAAITCVNEKYLSHEFCGREIDNSFLNDLPEMVDPCGENGEFHSFVYDGPVFRKPIRFDLGEIVHRQYKNDTEAKYDTGFWYIDLK
ncbi:MAG: diphthine--ammonia ligase [Bacteroidetes bacterium]|nr:diphthine--ammonia ligase [Bacteroidota bacterium]